MYGYRRKAIIKKVIIVIEKGKIILEKAPYKV